MFLTKDGNGNAIPLVPAVIPFATTKNTSISSAQSITLNPLTSFIEVQAIGGDVYVKFSAGVTTSSNGFNCHVMADTVRNFPLPAGTSVVSVIEGSASTTVIVIEY